MCTHLDLGLGLASHNAVFVLWKLPNRFDGQALFCGVEVAVELEEVDQASRGIVARMRIVSYTGYEHHEYGVGSKASSEHVG
jgi:hypothetical protein